MRTIWKLLIATVLVVTLVAVVVATSGSEAGDESVGPATTPDAGIPLHKSGSSNIYVMDVVSRSFVQVTNYHDKFARDPAWSTTGVIAFSEAPPSDFARLFLVKTDGTAKREVRTRAAHVFNPSWSPDAREVAVTRLARGIHVVNLRTGSARRLPGTGESDSAPAWSPDGKSIVFERHVSNTNWDLYRVDPAGGRPERLTSDSRQQINAAWSPDGSSLVFAEQHETGNWVLIMMRTDGSQRRALTDPKSSSQEPAWSPDGKRIAFVLQEGDRASIAVVAAGGGDPVRITPGSLIASRPTWSPDGKRIAFSAQVVARPAPTAPPGGGA